MKSGVPVLFFVLACGGTSTESTIPTATPNESVNAAAQTELERADERYEEFSQVRIDCTDQADVEGFIQCLQQQVRLLSGAAVESAEAYQRVLGHSEEAQWAVAALTGQARTFAGAVSALNNVEVPEIYPAALLEEDVRMSDEARLAVQEQVSASIRAVLDTQARSIACTRIIYDVMALRLALSQSVDSEYSQESGRRLSTSSEEEIAACVDEGGRSDEALEPYAPGELNLQR
ncbi:MAG: hypothetical protein ACI9KE_001202 [Polyangiales bacterium]|jgi:hypothetical protein